MTIPNPIDAVPLITDGDVLDRVRQLIGPAIAPRQMWIMFIDGDGRQAPVVMPISDIPLRPENRMIDNLAGVLAALCDDLATDADCGRVVLTLERTGRDAVLPGDREWARALAEACESAGAAMRGVYLSTSGGIHRMLPA
jgi:hypothetical protein